MSQFPSNDPQVIRITNDDAQSQHVEDLIKRQMSLRGEQGITRDGGRRWYYQNWLILAIFGMLGAGAGSALLEPVFHDTTYVQGRVTDVGPTEMYTSSEKTLLGAQSQTLSEARAITLDGGLPFKIEISDHTRRMDRGANFPLISLDDVKKGDFVGFYAAHEIEAGISHAGWVELHPKTEISTTRADLLSQEKSQMLVGLFYFGIIAGITGLFIGAADGIACRLVRRALLAGSVGLVAGLVGGCISGLLAGLVFLPLSDMARQHSGSMRFGLIIASRGLAWALAGMTMGLGQGIALRSQRLLLYGLLGGLVGGLFGGMVFDPIQLLQHSNGPSAWLSRLVAFMVLGGVVGFMIGIVERLARDAWLRMVEGPLAGKEFLIFKDIMRMGSSPRAEIYLFNDDQVSAQHAILRSTGDSYELENTCRENPVCINGRAVTRSRLRHGDRISLGRTAFVFQRKRGE